jgi:hypothetical protein
MPQQRRRLRQREFRIVSHGIFRRFFPPLSKHSDRAFDIIVVN